MESFFIPFVTIVLAEMLDKSQLAILLLSSRYKNHLALFGGIMSAFAILTGLAIITGSFITSLLPAQLIQIIAGTLFVLFGVLSIRSKPDKSKVKAPKQHTFFSGFTVLFLAEFGDKTQLATAVFSTQYNPWHVFWGALLALGILSFLALKIGEYLTRHVNKNTLQTITGIIFITLGVSFFLF